MPSKGVSFVKKFFCEGQVHDDQEEVKDHVQQLLHKHRKAAAILWLFTAYRYDWFSLYTEYWPLAIFMIAASIVIGLLNEGGGSFLFLGMTLIFGTDSVIASDFVLIIQALCFSCTVFSIFYKKLHIDHTALLLSFLGATIGFIAGTMTLLNFNISFPLEYNLKSDISFKATVILSVWLAFAIGLFTLYREDSRRVRLRADIGTIGGPLFVFTGLLGGIVMSLAGTGSELVLFTVMTLFFRASKRVTTATGIVLLAAVSQVAVYYRAVWESNVSGESWNYAKVSAPVVTLFVPFGAFIGAFFHKRENKEMARPFNYLEREIIGNGSSIMVLFYYRMDILLPRRHMLSRQWVRCIFYGVTYPFMALFSIPFIHMCLSQDEYSVKLLMFEEYRIVYPDIFNMDVSCVQYGSNNPATYFFTVTIALVCMYGLTVVFYSCITIRRIIIKNTLRLSDHSKRQHLEVMTALMSMATVFTSLVVFSIGPILFLVFTRSWRADILGYALLYVPIDIIICIFVYHLTYSPYRRAIWRAMKRATTKAPKSEISVAVKS